MNKFINQIIPYRMILESMLTIIGTEDIVQIRETGQFLLDGGGSRKGFGIWAMQEIPIGTCIDNVHGILLPLPKGYEVFI